MGSSYWKEMETQPTFKEWKEFYDGCVMCNCGHGCQQWIKEQQGKMSLLFEVLSNPNSTTKPDKIAQMSPERANKIWYKIMRWKSQKFNRELRQK